MVIIIIQLVFMSQTLCGHCFFFIIQMIAVDSAWILQMVDHEFNCWLDKSS